MTLHTYIARGRSLLEEKEGKDWLAVLEEVAQHFMRKYKELDYIADEVDDNRWQLTFRYIQMDPSNAHTMDVEVDEDLFEKITATVRYKGKRKERKLPLTATAQQIIRTLESLAKAAGWTLT